MATGQIVKIYKLETLGYQQLTKELDSILKKFESIKKAKQSAQQNLFTAADANDVKRYTDEVGKLAVQEQQLRVETERLTAEIKAAQLQRQVDINNRRREKEAVDAVAGSYNALYKEYRELYKLVKAAPEGSSINFRGEILQFDQAIAKLKELAAAEQDFRRQFARDGLLVAEYSSGIVQAFKSMGLEDLVSGQVTKATQKLEQLNQEFNHLQQELSETKVSGKGALEGIEIQLIENRKEALELQKQIGFLRTELRGTGDIGNQITTSISSGFKTVKREVGQLLISYLGVQAALSGVISTIDETKRLSDQTTDLARNLETSAANAQVLVDELSKINTRTKLSDLLDTANIAAKAGVSHDNIIGVVTAIDRLKLVFGDSLGDTNALTDSLIKLNNVFGQAGEVTEDALTKTGNAIIKLDQAGTASAPFLTDYASRVGQIAKAANLSLPAVLGLGAGFEELGLSAEVAGTATVTLLNKIAKDTEKFASVAGKPLEEFRSLLADNPVAALSAVAEGLTKDKGAFEEVATALGQAGIEASRVTGVITALGTNTEFFASKIDVASEAVANTNQIIDAANEKNDNLAATLDKVAKKFADAANSKAFQVTITAIASVVLFLLNNFGLFITIMTGFAGVLALANGQLIIQRAQLILLNAQILASRAALALITIAQTAYTTAISIYTGVTRVAAGATALLGNAMRLLPIGLILTVMGVLVATFRAFGSTIAGTTGDLRRMAIQKQLLADISRRVSDATTEEISKIQTLTKVASDNSISLQTRKKALDDLIAINPEYLRGLTLENIATQEGTNIINQYIAALREKAALQAAQAIRDEKLKEDARLQLLQTRLETRIASGDSQDLDDLSDEEKELVGNARKNFAFIASVTDLVTGDSAAKEALAALKLQRSNLATELDETDNLIKEKYKKIGEGIAAGPPTEGAAGEVAGTFEIDIEKLKADIKALDEQIDKFKGNQKELNKLLAERKRLQDLLDRALGNNRGGSNRGSRIGGQDRDALRDIDAIRDQELADERRYRARNLETEEQYLLNVRDINVAAIDEKLKLVSGSNAAERKLIADLKLERITQEQDTNNKIFELRKQALRNTLDLEIESIRLRVAALDDDASLTETQRAQAKLEGDQQILSLQVQYARELDSMEKQLGQQSLKNAKETADAIRKTQEDLRKDQIALIQASLKDVQNAGDQSVAEFRAIIARQRARINANENLSPDRRDRTNQVLDREERVGIVAREVASMRNQLPEYERLLKEKQITDTEYMNFQAELANKEAELADLLSQSSEEALRRMRSTRDLIQGSIRDMFNVREGSAEDQLIGQALNETYSLAADAMNNFFDQKEARIKRDLELELERIEIEKQQQLARAQSLQEQESLERQFAEKRKEAERISFERTKELKKKEAKIALLTELANIWTTVWQVGPIAGAILGGVLSALALVRYNSRIGEINAQTFAFGGQPGKTKRYIKPRKKYSGGGEVPTKGGEFGGKPHSQGGTPFEFKGQRYEAEVDELAVIRTRNAPRNRIFQAVGTQAQIASAMNVAGGGVDFAPGAQLRKFATGGMIGESLQPPQYIPSAFNRTLDNAGGISEEKFEEMIGEIRNLAKEQSSRIDRLEVYQVTTTVTQAQKKQVKQSELGTL